MASSHVVTPAQQGRCAKSGFSLIELLVVFGIIAVLVALILPAQRNVRPAARRAQCKNNLRQISLALDNYVQAYGSLPPAYTVDANGKPLHSWRTLILPFVDNGPLYAKIDLSKAWDDPANAEAFKTYVYAYYCPEHQDPAGKTVYLAMVGSNLCLHPTEPRPYSAIADRSKTLMVIEVDAEHAVPWMAPMDADEALLLSLSSKSKLGHAGGFHAAMADGSVSFLEAAMPAAERRAKIHISEGDPRLTFHGNDSTDRN